MIYVVTTQILPPSDRFEVITPQYALQLLEPLRTVGLDTETMGFDPYTKRLMLLQLGCYDFQVVIDCTTVDVHFFQDYLQSDRLFIGWNIKFDMKFLFHQRIVLRKVYDGFIAEKLMWQGFPSGFHSMALKAAGENYLGVELDKTIRGKVMWAGLGEDVIEYAANDVKYLEKIKDAQEVELKKKNLTTANVYEQKSVPWVAYTEYCGVLLDVKKWQYKMALDDFVKQVFEEALNEWVVASATGEDHAYWYIQTEGLDNKALLKARKKMEKKGVRAPEKDIKGKVRGYAEAYKVPIEHNVGKEFIKESLQGDLFLGFQPPTCAINWKSSKQVIPLFKSLGLNLQVKDAETGELKDSIEEKVISPQAHLSTLIYLFIEFQGASKLTSTYGQNVIDQINETSHRIHTNFNQLGTDTGRLSSGGKDKANDLDYLNFQNFPHDAETRACFVSGKDMKWISCDYSGQESRIIADVTNDPAMLDLFNNGSGDVHSLVAKMSYPDIVGDCPVEEIKDRFHEQRQDAKGVEFAINYGGDANTIANNKGIPIKEAQKIYDNYMKGFKGMKAYQDGQRKFVMNNGYILLNPFSLHKTYIYDYDILMGIKKRLTSEFWETYRMYKGQETFLPKAVKAEVCKKFADGFPNQSIVGVYHYKVKKGNKEKVEQVYVTLADTYVYPVKYFFKRKSDSEKQAINYPCQGTGAVMFKTASIFLWEYLLEHDLLFKVKLCVPAHDEWNIEVPKEIAEEMTKVLQDCMSRAGEFFCTKLPMPADAVCSDHWIH